MAITVKSLDPRSAARKWVVDIQTTASIGPGYVIVPFDCKLDSVKFGAGIKTTSDKAFYLKNVANSRVYFNSAVVQGSNVVGQVAEIFPACASYITANTLLSVEWTATKGDYGASLIFTLEKERQ